MQPLFILKLGHMENNQIYMEIVNSYVGARNVGTLIKLQAIYC
jgi:hypothetical protein